MRNAHRVAAGKPKEKRQLVRPRSRGDNIPIGVKRIKCNAV
jgi:hypothetical protein